MRSFFKECMMPLLEAGHESEMIGRLDVVMSGKCV
jgi:hypothetical protein